MKTRIILFLLCLITMNVMGQNVNGTITRQRKTQTEQKQKPNGASNNAQAQRKKIQQQPAASASKPKLTLNNLMSNMVYVEGGTFTMGATSEQQNPDLDEKPAHSVTLSSYYICKYEVTQALWKAVMGSNPSNRKGDNFPVEMVSWDDCQNFLRKLNATTGKKFRLPTEAEWEYAARGGNRSRGYQYSGSNNLSDVAWFYDNSGSKTHAVGTKSPNELGIYDMSGNVWECCQDWKGRYSSSAQTNPIGPDSAFSHVRVLRGGSSFNADRDCRVSRRYFNTHDPNVNLGFRLALSE